MICFQIFSALGLVCLTSAGVQTEGGYLRLPLAWHLRAFVFVSVCGFLTSLMVILLHVSGLIKSAPINWHLFVSTLQCFLFNIKTTIFFFSKAQNDILRVFPTRYTTQRTRNTSNVQRQHIFHNNSVYLHKFRLQLSYIPAEILFSLKIVGVPA